MGIESDNGNGENFAESGIESSNEKGGDIVRLGITANATASLNYVLGAEDTITEENGNDDLVDARLMYKLLVEQGMQVAEIGPVSATERVTTAMQIKEVAHATEEIAETRLDRDALVAALGPVLDDMKSDDETGDDGGNSVKYCNNMI